MKLLYAEDEIQMAEAVEEILRFHKYTVDVAHDGEEALSYARMEKYDGIILDIMMPKKSGFEVLRTLRSEGCRTPVLLLTAKSEIEDRIEGLDAGADDYLSKPFAMGELLARVRAMLRRRETYQPDLITFGDLTLNPADFTVSCKGRTEILPNLEYRMMETLLLNRGVYLKAEDLLRQIWGYDSEADINTVRVYISALRRRLKDLDAKEEIRSRRNIGYIIEETA
jgi:DNA-binding response OmpR family regulator